MIVYRVAKNKGFTLNFLGEFEEIDPTKIHGTVECIDLLNEQGESKIAVKVGRKLYEYNGGEMAEHGCMENAGRMEEQDIAAENIEIVRADTGSLQHFQNNWYQKKFAFDCMVEDRREGSYQPLAGLQVVDGRIELITHAFSHAFQQPVAGDILQYRGNYWTVEEVQISYTYAPKESKTLHIAIKELSNAV